jgi:hypothetical protein
MPEDWGSVVGMTGRTGVRVPVGDCLFPNRFWDPHNHPFGGHRRSLPGIKRPEHDDHYHLALRFRMGGTIASVFVLMTRTGHL